MDLSRLKPLFEDDSISTQADHTEISTIYDQFVDDFITNPFELNGKKIRIDRHPPKVSEFAAYNETFFHLITRKLSSQNIRSYECNRANRVHWIKPILLSHPTNQVKYYKWMDQAGICKEHYWLFAKNFMVVTKDVEPDVKIVTAFCVDSDSKEVYYDRFMKYREGRGTC